MTRPTKMDGALVVDEMGVIKRKRDGGGRERERLRLLLTRMISPEYDKRHGLVQNESQPYPKVVREFSAGIPGCLLRTFSLAFFYFLRRLSGYCISLVGNVSRQ